MNNSQRFSFRAWYEGKMHYNVAVCDGDVFLNGKKITGVTPTQWAMIYRKVQITSGRSDLRLNYNVTVCDGEVFLNEVKIAGAILMQWAGVFDRRNRPVYEGDLVKADDWSDADIIRVYWSPIDLKCTYDLHVAYELQPLCGPSGMCGYSARGSEVIGNVFENPNQFGRKRKYQSSRPDRWENDPKYNVSSHPA